MAGREIADDSSRRHFSGTSPEDDDRFRFRAIVYLRYYRIYIPQPPSEAANGAPCPITPPPTMSASSSSLTAAHSAQDYANAIDRSVPSFTAAQEPDEKSYFNTNLPPPELEEYSERTEQFVRHHYHHQRRVVLITSGGTTVPLENQTVRFIDNFSAGTRGATSAEYFLEAGYAVIFLHRQFSLLPYSRHYSHSTNCFLDFLSEAQPTDGYAKKSAVMAKGEYSDTMLSVLRKYNHAKRENLLLLLPFTTINSYLFLLRALAMKMEPMGSKALFYLAAAVSDFFIPRERMSEHKIQSGDFNETQLVDPAASGVGKKLIIDLDPVPKFLKRLVESWAPKGMIVSFKANSLGQLETDEGILLKKCRLALERYSHHLVIGNLLQTRKFEVVLVDSVDPQKQPRRLTLQRDEANGVKFATKQDMEIEEQIVTEVVRRHGARIWDVVATTGSLPE
ncbi:LOW QUALITY PROTEIN: Phosphopantothenate--cysteine ligase CAB2 [Drechslerella dactyloides]|uniref:Phosphopantothenate--cysteine ligase CAB2 n=1 Tax=Drechslerella dactyloides TaxID=74499 RepID=A0AAD6IXD1_DREDA|nr:LOW QUALITY PROTEIN: Phosphopantothenate--cysteine ligase CAB2 [Drechslerella dactyloides]